MKQEDKELLLRDLCARLFCGVIVTDNRHGNSVITEIDTISYTVYCYDFDEYVPIEKCLPYLRPMSSMTEEELKTFYRIEDMEHPVIWNIPQPSWHFSVDGIDWLLSKHFDYRGLIGKGLAIEVTKENNPYES